MKTIRQLQFEDELTFLCNVMLIDFFRVFWVYLIIWLVAKIYL